MKMTRAQSFCQRATDKAKSVLKLFGSSFSQAADWSGAVGGFVIYGIVGVALT
jgi:hypothetical protein